MRYLKVYEKKMDVSVPLQDIQRAVGTLSHEVGPSQDGYIEVGIECDWQQFKSVARQFNRLGYETNLGNPRHSCGGLVTEEEKKSCPDCGYPLSECKCDRPSEAYCPECGNPTFACSCEKK